MKKRPSCIDGARCQHVSGWHGYRVPRTDKRDVTQWYCRQYGVYLRFDKELNVLRCAACRRDWPNEEEP